MSGNRVNRTCFVISPIGEPGSPTREHADDVYDYIVRPALEACGVVAVRSDHLLEPGKITDQMFRELFGSDFCVAVLTGHNPNVFYELALAQAASRPVVVLIEQGQQLPFDIRDQRCVVYDLKPRSLFDRVHLEQLVAHVRSIERQGWRVEPPFGRYSGLFTGRRTEEKYDVFLSCPVAGVRDDEQFRETRAAVLGLLACLEQECKARVFYAGRHIDSRDAFDHADFTLVSAVQGITESRNFLLVYPDRLVSSVLVEAGVALALNKPSAYLVRNRGDLPFLLRHVDKAFPIKVYEYQAIDQILTLLRLQGDQLFRRGAGAEREGRPEA